MLSSALDMTTFARCQSETCLEMHIFQNGTPLNLKHISGWHMFQNGTQHVGESWGMANTILLGLINATYKQDLKSLVYNHKVQVKYYLTLNI